MNKEQELKIELLELQSKKLEQKRENLTKQIDQIAEKIDRIRRFSDNQSSKATETFVSEDSSTSMSSFTSEF